MMTTTRTCGLLLVLAALSLAQSNGTTMVGVPANTPRGIASGQESTTWLAGPGDIDGDMVNDLIVGDHSQERVFIYSGANGDLLHEFRLYPGPTMTPHHFGWSVSGAGDIDLDGVPDILVGAPHYEPPVAPYQFIDDTGSVWVLSGAYVAANPGGMTELSGWPPLPSAAVLHVIIGDAHTDWLGYCVSSAGHTNQGPNPDIVAGAPKAQKLGTPTGGVLTEVGYARIYSGEAIAANIGGVSTLECVITEIEGAHAGANMGWSVSGVGDINNNGYDDVVVGAPRTRKPLGFGTYMFNAGALYAMQATGPEAAWGPVYGSQESGQFAFSVSGCGDLNGDGRPDILVGEPFLDVNGKINAGRVTIISGITMPAAPYLTPYMTISPFDIPTPDPDPARDYFGWSLSGAGAAANNGAFPPGFGSIDGNATPDIVIGAPGGDFIDPPQYLEGYAVALSNTGTLLYQEMGGRSVCGLGDLDGNSTYEVAIGGGDFTRVTTMTQLQPAGALQAVGSSCFGAPALLSATVPSTLDYCTVSIDGTPPGASGVLVMGATPVQPIPIGNTGAFAYVEITPIYGILILLDLPTCDASGSWSQTFLVPPRCGCCSRCRCRRCSSTSADRFLTAPAEPA